MFARFSQFISVTLLFFLLLFGSTSMEFLHSFANHKDTVHHQHSDGSLSFETQHHHCGFLNLSIAAFNNDYDCPVIHFRVVGEYAVSLVAITARTFSFKFPGLFLRGPPCV